MNMLQTIQPTMSSVELVEIINSMRPDDAAQVRHSNLLAKIKRNPQIDEKKFASTYKDSTGRSLKCYHLPKREVIMLLADSHPRALAAVAERIGDMDTILDAIRDFEVPEECSDMYVYAIRNTTTGAIKLGISRNPQQRLKQLQTGNDCKLELVAYSKAENRFQDETALHHAHAAAHIRGEWFDQSAAFAIAQ